MMKLLMMNRRSLQGEYWPRVHKAFQVQDQDQAQFQNEYCLDYIPLSVQENLIIVYIDMVNVVLDLECIRLKYMENNTSNVLNRLHTVKV